MTKIRNAEFSKVIAAVAIVGMIAFGFSFAVPQAQALTQADVDIICAIVGCDASTQAALSGLVSGGTSSSSFTFTQDLTMGSTGQEVMELQKFLNANGFTVSASGAGSAGSESTYFGSLTATALSSYQAANGITPAVGYFGPITRSSVNSTVGTGSTGTGSTGSTGTGSLSGGAGSVDSYTLISSFNNEKVGEAEDDVEVIGLEIEVDEGSDLNFRAVKLNFDWGTADDDLDEYVSEVSVYLDGEEVARVDSDKFDDDNSYQATISFDEDAVIEAGDKGDLSVAVSGISNLDSGDASDTWTVDIVNVRFIDAQDATITDTTSTDTRTFTMETFAAAQDVELKITDGDSSINDARVVEIHASDDTDGVELFSFNVEAEGDSDIEFKDVPVTFTSVGTNVDDIANTVYLYADGEKIASENVLSTATTTSQVEFDDVDYTISAGDKVEIVVKADINDIEAGTFDEGDTLSVAFGETETDKSFFDAEDEEGTNLVDADKTGSADSDAHAFYSIGIQVTLEDISESVSSIDTNNQDDSVLLTIKYSITAFGGDVWVSESPVGTVTTVATIGTNGVGGIGDDSVLYVLEKGSTPTVGSSVSAPDTYVTVQSDGTDAGAANGIKINEDGTVNFTLSVSHTNTTSGDGGQYRLSLGGVSWEDAAAGADEFLYTFDLDDFQTDYVLVN